jgi:hypothetical protein
MLLLLSSSGTDALGRVYVAVWPLYGGGMSGNGM